MRAKRYKGIDQATIGALDDLTEGRDCDVFNKIDELGAIHSHIMDQKWGRFCGQTEAYITLLAKGFTQLNLVSKINWKPYMGLQWRLIDGNLLSLVSSLELLKKGRYADSIALSRKAYEAFVSVIWIACHNKEPYGAFINTSEGSWIKYDKFFRESLGLDWKAYSLMSHFSHAGRFPILQEIAENQASKKLSIITPRITYNENYARLAHRLISFDTMLFIRQLLYFFKISVPLDPKTTVLQREAESYYELREVDFRTEEEDKESYWPEVLDDLEDIITLQQRCSDGDLYEDAWNQIRKLA